MRRSIIMLVFLYLIGFNTGITSETTNISLDNDRTALSVKTNDPSLLHLHNSLAEINFIEVKSGAGVFTKIVLEGYTKNDNPGDPELPVLSKLIEVPYGAEVKVKVISYNVETIALEASGINSKIIPSQPPVSKSLDPDDVEFEYNEKVYSTDEMITSVPASVKFVGKMRGRQLARLIICPFRYNPVRNILEVLNDIEIEIKFENADFKTGSALKQKYYSPVFEKAFSNLLNYSPAKSKDSLSRYPIKYVIVADPMFQNSLQPFVEWKTKKGFTVIEAYTNNTSVGNTTTSIKTYLEGLYNSGTAQDPAPTFVLFAGDVAQVPAFQVGGHVTDLYYCEYDGGGDYMPELYYGRFSANNPGQIESQVEKTLEYEQYLMPDVSFLDEVVMIAGVDANYAAIHGNGQINYGTDHYFNAAHGLLSHTYLYPASGGASSQIIQNVSNGAAYVNYTAHGSPNGWADPSFTKNDIVGLLNTGKYPLMVGNCCSTNTFDDPECFGEALLRANDKGALAYIGASNSTYWDEDYYWGVGVGPIVLNPSYSQTSLGAYDGSFHDNGEPQSQWYPTQAQMMFAGNLAVTSGAPSSAQYYWEIYHLMGDPSLMVYFSVPAPLNANHYASVPVGMNSITVTTEPGAYVAISFNGVLLDAQLVDSSGTVNLNFSPLVNVGVADIVATKQNRQPYFGAVNVIPGNTPFVIYNSHNIDDSKGNSDGMADFNEDIMLDVKLENVGSQMAQGVEAKLTSFDQFVGVTDSIEVWGNISASATSLKNGAFEFITSDEIPDQHIVSFALEIEDNSGGNWNSILNITVNAPELNVGDIIVTDINGGNGDGIIDPGETIEVSVECLNNGHSDAPSTASILSSASMYLNIVNSSIALGNLAKGNTTNAIYTVDIDAATPVGTPLDFDFSLASGLYNVQSDFILKVGMVAEDFETGDFLKFPWTTSGNKPWFASANNPYEGIYCAESGDIGGNQLSLMMLSMNAVVDDSISFFRKVSSELDYDFLKFYIDNQLEDQWSGEMGWARMSYPVTSGVHTFKWVYEKDFWASSGDDCGWIDFIVFPPVSVSSSAYDIKPGESFQVNIYPNPFSNNINIQFPSDISWHRISIYDAAGQLIEVIDDNNESSPVINKNIFFNLSELESGAYYIKVENEKNLVVKKIIKL